VRIGIPVRFEPGQDPTTIARELQQAVTNL